MVRMAVSQRQKDRLVSQLMHAGRQRSGAAAGIDQKRRLPSDQKIAVDDARLIDPVRSFGKLFAGMNIIQQFHQE